MCLEKHSEIKVVEESRTVKLLIFKCLGINLGVLFLFIVETYELKLGCGAHLICAY
jgi:hypothetical protein